MPDREAFLRRKLEREPADAALHGELAAHYFSVGELEDAAREYRRACELAPDLPEGHYNLAATLNANGDTIAALEVIENAEQTFPDNGLIHYGKACVLQRLGRLDDALASFTISLELDPNHADAWYGVGVLLLRQGDPRRAGSFFERALDVSPDHSVAQYMREALAGEARSRPDKVFVRELFDSYAGYYDCHMLETLGYRAPQMLCAALADYLGNTPDVRMLDLGCGTGLVGAGLRSMADRLVGVDLAEGMLDRARSLGCYDELVCADVVEYLSEQASAAHDVVVSADLFIYFADLEDVFTAIRKVLVPGGLFAFTVEADESDGWSVGPSGRFRHSGAYLETLRDTLNFTAMSLERAVLRHDGGEPCQGFIVVWSLADSPPTLHM